MHQLKVLLPLLVLAAATPPLNAQARAHKSGVQTQAVRPLDESTSNLEQLNKIHANTVELHNKLSILVYSDLERKVADLGKLAARSSTTREQLIEAARQLQETQMGFNHQYLQLQNQMQNENRQYTMVSNIMKTGHATVKNAISNVR
jgi:hypothetical protein